MKTGTSQPELGMPVSIFRQNVERYCKDLGQNMDNLLKYENMTANEETLTALLNNKPKFFYAVFACMEKSKLLELMEKYSDSLKSQIRKGVKETLRQLNILKEESDPGETAASCMEEINVMKPEELWEWVKTQPKPEFVHEPLGEYVTMPRETYLGEWIRGTLSGEWDVVPDSDIIQEPYNDSCEQACPLLGSAARQLDFIECYQQPLDHISTYLYHKMAGLCDLCDAHTREVFRFFRALCEGTPAKRVYFELDQVTSEPVYSAVVWLLHDFCKDQFELIYNAQLEYTKHYIDVYVEGRTWLDLFMRSPMVDRMEIIEILKTRQKGILGMMKRVCGDNSCSKYVHSLDLWVSLCYIAYHFPEIDGNLGCIKSLDCAEPFSLLVVPENEFRLLQSQKGRPRKISK